METDDSVLAPSRFNAAAGFVDGRGLTETWGAGGAAWVEAALRRGRAQVLGDGPRWHAAVAALERFGPVSRRLAASAPEFGEPAARPEEAERAGEITELLLQLAPWRKGPFCVLGVELDAEWRCDRKWARVQAAVELEGKTVLDVGCGNGYYLLRALGDGAKAALGIDPTWLYVAQFAALRRLVSPLTEQPVASTEGFPVWVLPLALEDLPTASVTADVVFSMGVLYHRKSPIEHLEALRSLVSPGGQLVLETLVVPGDEHTVLTPADRYAAMRNVWMIPSVEAVKVWLRRCGYREPRVVDVSVTTSEEQRRTAFMPSASLADFLSPADPTLTVEGYPAPQRALFVATRP